MFILFSYPQIDFIKNVQQIYVQTIYERKGVVQKLPFFYWLMTDVTIRAC